MEFSSIEYSSINLDGAKTILSKRERAVYFKDGLYYKIWVPNWSKSEILSYALSKEYYNKSICSAFKNLIHDSTGPRGYIAYAGKSLSGDKTLDWSNLINSTLKKERLYFISEIINNSFIAKGIYADLAPANIISYKNKLSLIDLESFASFSMIFNRKLESYEKFDLNAWWKPYETAKRDVDLFYRSYLLNCLGIKYDKPIDSIKSLSDIASIININKAGL